MKNFDVVVFLFSSMISINMFLIRNLNIKNEYLKYLKTKIK